MISMTTYWQQFKECIDNLPAPLASEEYSRQMNIANSMIEIGVTIEKLNLIAIKNVTDQLQEKAKQFQNEVLFSAGEMHRFFLPRITQPESLMFAIIYYQHLTNYEQVSYQGSIYFGHGYVVNRVEEKKITTRIQSRALLEEIKKYCQSQKLSIDESGFLKNTDESTKDYCARIVKMVKKVPEQKQAPIQETPVPIQPVQEIPVSTQVNELARLEHKREQMLEDINNRRMQLNSKAEGITKKIAEVKRTKQNFSVLNNEWQSKWLITKFFYWIISWVYQPPAMKNLKESHAQLLKAESDLEQEVPHLTAENYHAELKKQLQALDTEYDNTQEEINREVELEKAKQEAERVSQLEKLKQEAANASKIEQEEKQSENTTEVINTAEEKPLLLSDPAVVKSETGEAGEIRDHSLSSNLNYYYSFFKENRPSNQTLLAAAVAGAAMIVPYVL